MVEMSSTYNTWINITIKYQSGLNQVHIGTVSHLQFGYFDLVNPVDQVKHGSQGND